jgi:UDP-2,3-diacylglucosamine hydrolase
VDLPAIGPRTMVNARKAGLEGIAIGAHATLILEQERTIEAADRLGLFLVAIDPEKQAPKEAS